LLLLLLLMGTSLAGAFPREPSRKSCGLSKYRFLLPSELRPIQAMKEQFEKIMLLSGRKCNTRVFHRKWSPAELSVPDRVLLVEAELDLVMEALRRPVARGLMEQHWRPLSFLAQAREDLRGCVSVSPAAPLGPTHQPSGKLRHWLHRLETAKSRVSVARAAPLCARQAGAAMTVLLSPLQEPDGCLEDSAIQHLFKVLSDLKCAALREECA
ncbi:IFNL3 protein, partial [Eudromia elegans]|nr:IFNL3 protein [Eudromia elegans]